MNFRVLDLSAHQGDIDFSRVKKDGTWGVMLKATEGQSYLSPAFDKNYEQAIKAGLHVGAYHYLRAANALDSLFMSMKIEDISIEIRDNQLVAFDSDGNKWVENEIFDFALNECLTFGADGHLIDGYCINEELLDQILHYAAQRDVKIERIPL